MVLQVPALTGSNLADVLVSGCLMLNGGEVLCGCQKAEDDIGE